MKRLSVSLIILMTALVLTSQGLVRQQQPAGASGGSWVTVANLPTVRNSLMVAAGGDGRIYAIGGDVAYMVPTSIVEAYDPATDSWSRVADLPVALSAGGATTGLDGRIYVFGGQISGPNWQTVVQVYDPASNAWSTSSSMPTPRTTPAVATGLDGRIYVIGGNNGAAMSAVEVYDPAGNSWSTAASLPVPQASENGATTGPDGRIYVVGGYYGSGPNTFTPGLVQVYTPCTNSWSTATDMLSGRYALAAATGTDGQIYAIGGGDSAGGFSNIVEAYDPAGGAWSAAPSLNFGRYTHGAAALPDGRIYAVGGGNAMTNIVECLATGAVPCVGTPPQPPSGEWSLIASTNAPGPLAYPSMVYDPSRNRLLLFGGESSAEAYRGEFWEYPLPGGPWLQLTAQPDPVYGVPGARLGHSAVWDPSRNQMLIFGGHYCWGCNYNDIWAYDSDDNSWIRLPDNGTLPFAGYLYASVWDPIGDRMLVFSGYEQSYIYHNELRQYSRASNSWSQLSPAGGPPATREGAAAVWDSLNNRMLVFGGHNLGGYHGDLWVYVPAINSWQQLSPAGDLPTARSRVAVGWDPITGQMTVYGGRGSAGLLAETWAFSVGTNSWQQIATTGTSPGTRADAGGTVANGRMYVYGGGLSDVVETIGQDFWTLCLSGSCGTPATPTPTPTVSPTPTRTPSHPPGVGGAVMLPPAAVAAESAAAEESGLTVGAYAALAGAVVASAVAGLLALASAARGWRGYSVRRR
jgi:N-acetylneuraminic acid mutarotase